MRAIEDDALAAPAAARAAASGAGPVGGLARGLGGHAARLAAGRISGQLEGGPDGRLILCGSPFGRPASRARISGAAQLIGHRALGRLDHVLAAVGAHPVSAHHGVVLGGRLDDHDLGPEAAHLALLALEAAARGAPGDRGDQVEHGANPGRPLGPAGERVEADHEVEPATRHQVHVRHRADAAVHVAPPADLHGPEEARDRARGRHRVPDLGPWRADAAERRAASGLVVARDGPVVRVLDPRAGNGASSRLPSGSRST